MTHAQKETKRSIALCGCAVKQQVIIDALVGALEAVQWAVPAGFTKDRVAEALRLAKEAK